MAANYIKSCVGLWIVSPINRAVDDKTAKTLLGDPFKCQVKYDGTYSTITFICSKTEDISVLEASESLGFEDDISKSYDQSEDLWRAKLDLKKKVGDLNDRKATYNETIEEIEAKWDTLDDLRGQAADGNTVYAPGGKPASRKRKRQGKTSRRCKDQESSDDDDDWSAKENS